MCFRTECAVLSLPGVGREYICLIGILGFASFVEFKARGRPKSVGALMVDDEQIIGQLVFIGKNCGFGDVGAEREAL